MFRTIVPAVRSQRGVGWTQVLKPPLVIRYFFEPDLLDRLAEEVDVGLLPGRAAAPTMPPAGAAWRGGWTLAMPAGVVEGAEPGLGVELGAVGGDAVVALGERRRCRARSRDPRPRRTRSRRRRAWCRPARAPRRRAAASGSRRAAPACTAVHVVAGDVTCAARVARPQRRSAASRRRSGRDRMRKCGKTIEGITTGRAASATSPSRKIEPATTMRGPMLPRAAQRRVASTRDRDRHASARSIRRASSASASRIGRTRIRRARQHERRRPRAASARSIAVGVLVAHRGEHQRAPVAAARQDSAASASGAVRLCAASSSTLAPVAERDASSRPGQRTVRQAADDARSRGTGMPSAVERSRMRTATTALST